MTGEKKKTEEPRLRIDFQSFAPDEDVIIEATVVAESHEEFLALRKMFEEKEDER